MTAMVDDRYVSLADNAEWWSHYRHFTADEFRCPCCRQQKMKRALLDRLDYIRETMQRSMRVTSGFRCPIHNSAIGGAKHSAHLVGLAADISVAGWSAGQVRELAMLGLTHMQGVGLRVHGAAAGRYVHLDVLKPGDRLSTRPAIWTYR